MMGVYTYLMSQTRATASRPPVTSTSNVGWRDRQYTPDKWPWYDRMTLMGLMGCLEVFRGCLEVLEVFNESCIGSF